MILSKEEIIAGIDFFRNRAKKEPEFCESLYKDATIRLLAMKYHYYVLGTIIADDIQYDLEEAHWYVMGRALGHLEVDEISPCVDFDESHPLAAEGIKLALKLKPKR